MRKNHNEYMYTKMRFGKYKGRYLKDVPCDYLHWIYWKTKDRATKVIYETEIYRRQRASKKK